MAVECLVSQPGADILQWIQGELFWVLRVKLLSLETKERSDNVISHRQKWKACRPRTLYEAWRIAYTEEELFQAERPHAAPVLLTQRIQSIETK